MLARSSMGSTLCALAFSWPTVAPAATGFPTPLSPDLPYDVDITVLHRLDRDNQIPEAQRLFDIFSWQAPDRTIVFGTESCAGCHVSAGAAVAFKSDEKQPANPPN